MLSLFLITPKMLLPFAVAMVCLVALIDAASIAVRTAAAEKSDAAVNAAEVDELAGAMKKRFYSWEEGKRSVNFDEDDADAMHWKRPVYSFSGRSGGRSFVAASAPPASAQVASSGGGAGGRFQTYVRHQFSHPSLYFVRQPLFLH